MLFSRRLLKGVSFYPNDFSLDLAIYLSAKKEGFEVIRFPVNFNKKARQYGSGSSSSLTKQLKGTMEQIYNSFIILIK